MLRLATAVLALLCLASGAATQLEAQTPTGGERLCTLRVEPGGRTTRTGTVMEIHDPFRVVCDDGANLRANTGTFDQVARVVTLVGGVYFEDLSRSLTSERAVYNNGTGVLHATGEVVFVDREEGTTLSGPELEYFRATETRPEPLVNAYGRPRLTMQRLPLGPDAPEEQQPEQPADTAGMPLTIDADRMTIVGNSDLTATGNVVIQDDDIRAVAEEAEQLGTAETLELRGSAAIHSQEYSLSGEVIFATVPDGEIREVEARGNARLVGEDLDVDAPRIDLVFAESLLQRSVAVGDSASAPGVQPIASSPTFRLQADSIDAVLPGQRLEMVVAVGNARGESIDTTRAEGAADGMASLEATLDAVAGGAAEAAETAADTLGVGEEAADGVIGDPVPAEGAAPLAAPADTTAMDNALRLVQNDWITGDTITGYFTSVVESPQDSVPSVGEELEPVPLVDAMATDTVASDTTLVLERLVAVGAARSLYHVAPEEDAAPGTLPGLNFLSAAHIELIFGEGQVQVANVEGLRRGLYLDPQPPPAEDGEGEGEDEEDEAEASPPDGEDSPPPIVEPAEQPSEETEQ